MSVLAGARVVTPGGVLDPGWVRIDDGRITDVRAGAPDEPGTDLGGAWLLPGFVDVHVHGGGGHDVTSSPDELADAVAFHRGRGTTRTLVSLVTAPVDALCEQLAWIADAAERGPGADGYVVGAHLEGPFLAHSHCGAQNPAHLVEPDPVVLDRLLTAGRGHVRMITIAPELPGALDLMPPLLAAGVLPSLGHTGAGYAESVAGLDAGARAVTHLGNGMPPFRQREPGLIGAALEARPFCEVINDGFHVHPALVRLVRPDRLVFITDAMSAAGASPGRYQLGGQDVLVADGAARLTNGSLAGSTITMDDAVRNAVQLVGLPIEVAAVAAATNPARMLGLDGRCGAIAAGLDADLVVLDDDLRPVRVMAQGEWVR